MKKCVQILAILKLCRFFTFKTCLFTIWRVEDQNVPIYIQRNSCHKFSNKLVLFPSIVRFRTFWNEFETWNDFQISIKYTLSRNILSLLPQKSRTGGASNHMTKTTKFCQKITKVIWQVQKISTNHGPCFS